MVTARGAGIAMASHNQRIAFFGNPALCLSDAMTWLGKAIICSDQPRQRHVWSSSSPERYACS